MLKLLLPLLLLYETSGHTWDERVVESVNAEEGQVPVWARKAGFNLKAHPKSESEPLDPDEMSEVHKTSQVMSAESQGAAVFSAMTKKEKRQHKNRATTTTTTETPGGGEPLSSSGEIEISSSGESDCGDEDHYWHIRGKHCVPLECPGGNNWRDNDSGDCILKKVRGRKGRKGKGKWKRKYSQQFGVPAGAGTGLVNNGRWVHG